jgi:hypothetical protein
MTTSALGYGAGTAGMEHDRLCSGEQESDDM